MVQLILVKIIGLTGPIGAGKDEVAKILRRRGALVIDADKLAHTLYVSKSLLWKKIVKAFGPEILNKSGEINRKKLGKIVFSDRRKLKKLNKLVHPYLKKAIVKKIEGRKLIVINAAVLKEIGLVSLCDEVWVVMAPKETRLKRLLKSGLPIKDARKRIDSQMGRKDYSSVGTAVVENNGPKQKLRERILDLLG
ncbi:MAG: dephospho-CoA kinase [Candidatus Margulisiibacteriota bacterium]|nr:dephospho-CoA kinase [Candidatus Margulisiibacteriota bacterium]